MRLLVHCHQNNDPTLPMQMMVEMKLNSKIKAPEGLNSYMNPMFGSRKALIRIFVIILALGTNIHQSLPTLRH